MVNLLKFNKFNPVFLAILISLTNWEMVKAEIATQKIQLTQANQIIQGQSGGLVDSKGCGFIASSPNYEMNLEQRIDYLRLTVQTTGGQPTLLVLGPRGGDSFCVLGDELSGLKPEISGVWEAGSYQIYVGDRLGSTHPFILNVSHDN
ncbi:hypothetical protein NIES4102_13070 [Chondrocystis sp. NIES-4102]|nr:hypothetical protein NIES4102_13070 [Chondrocystis sp. NIES-4102]